MNEFDCKDIRAMLSGIVDGELDEATHHRAERHLSSCSPCRELVNQTEKLNGLVALDAQRNLWPAGLPAGFEQAVLRRTVFAEAYHYAGRRWTSWMGWMAAAACFALAMSLWFVNNRQPQSNFVANSPQSGQASTALPPRVALNPPYATNARSWTYDGSLPAEALRVTRAASMASADIIPATHHREVMPSISIEDADTLYATSNLLEMLRLADLSSFSDIERIRQIAEYDELLDRLAASRDRLSEQDRPAIMAAEGVLLRVVNGPVSVDDLRSLNQTVARLDLSQQIESISSRWRPDSSL